MKQKSIADRLFSGVNISLLLVISAVMLFPFVYLFSVSFSSFEDFLGSKLLLWPSKWTTDAYEYIWASRTFRQALLNTSVVTVLGTIVNLFFTATMAYALSRPIVGQRTVMFMIVFALLFSAGMIPTYLVVNELGLIDSYWSIWLVNAIIPFNMIIIRSYFQTLPKELKESARMDGCGEFKILLRIILPVSMPTLVTFTLFYTVVNWNTYFQAVLYLNDADSYPLQVFLRQVLIVNPSELGLAITESGYMFTEGVRHALILLAALPLIVVYPFMQRHFSKGMMMGSVKG